MVLDSLHEGRIDITELSQNSPEQADFIGQEFSFNPEDYMTDEEWQRYQTWLDTKTSVSKDNIASLASSAADFKLAMPEGFKRIKLPDFKLYMQNSIVRDRNDKEWVKYLRMVSYMWSLFPDGTKIFKPKENEWPEVKEELISLKEGDHTFGRFIRGIEYLASIDPEKLKEFTITREQWEKFKKQLTELFQKGDFEEYAESVALVKVFYSHLFPELRFGQEEWKKIAGQMQARSHLVPFFRVARYLKSMKILAARRVEFTDEGYSFEMKPTTEHDPKAFPVERTF
jgi:hypothetical protein